MKILILAAMGKEVDLILHQMAGYKEVEEKGFTAYTGKIGECDVVLAQCGIGKVNAALRAQRLIDIFRPEIVINSGVAGSLDESVNIGSVLVPDAIAYHDVWCGPGTIHGQADGCPEKFIPDARCMEILHGIAAEGADHIRFGLIASGDIFISKPQEVTHIKSIFPDALGCDMESAAIAQACHYEGVPFVVVRVMSDMPGGGENISEYQNFWGEAPKRTFQVLTRLIESL